MITYLSPIPGAAGARLAQLEKEHADLKGRLAQFSADERAARLELQAAQNDLVEATTKGPAAERKALSRRAAAQAKRDEPWDERRQGVERLVRTAEQAWNAHVGQHAGDLADAMREAFEPHVAELAQAIEATRAALATWNADNQRFAVLLMPTGINGQELPRAPELSTVHESVQAVDLDAIPTPGIAGDRIREAQAPHLAAEQEAAQASEALSEGLRTYAEGDGQGRTTRETWDPAHGRRAAWSS